MDSSTNNNRDNNINNDAATAETFSIADGYSLTEPLITRSTSSSASSTVTATTLLPTDTLPRGEDEGATITASVAATTTTTAGRKGYSNSNNNSNNVNSALGYPSALSLSSLASTSSNSSTSSSIGLNNQQQSRNPEEERIISVSALDGAKQSIVIKDETRTTQIVAALAILANIQQDIVKYFHLYLVIYPTKQGSGLSFPQQQQQQQQAQSFQQQQQQQQGYSPSTQQTRDEHSSPSSHMPLVYCLKPGDRPLHVLQQVEAILSSSARNKDENQAPTLSNEEITAREHQSNNTSSNSNQNMSQGPVSVESSLSLFAAVTNSASSLSQIRQKQQTSDWIIEFFFADSRAEHWFQESNSIPFDVGTPGFLNLLEKLGAVDRAGTLYKLTHRRGSFSTQQQQNGQQHQRQNSSPSDGSTWEPRWFVLRGNRFWYCKSQHDQSTIVEIPLAHNSIRIIANEKGRFDFHTNHRVIHLLAKSDEDMKGWVDALNQRIATSTEHDIMKTSEFLIADQEKSSSTSIENLLSTISNPNSNGYESMDCLLSIPEGIDLFLHFCRVDHSDYLVLLMFDLEKTCKKIIKNQTSNDELETSIKQSQIKNFDVLSSRDALYFCSRFLGIPVSEKERELWSKEFNDQYNAAINAARKYSSSLSAPATSLSALNISSDPILKEIYIAIKERVKLGPYSRFIASPHFEYNMALLPLKIEKHKRERRQRRQLDLQF